MVPGPKNYIPPFFIYIYRGRETRGVGKIGPRVQNGPPQSRTLVVSMHLSGPQKYADEACGPKQLIITF